MMVKTELKKNFRYFLKTIHLTDYTFVPISSYGTQFK